VRQRARELRKNQTPAEQMLWRQLRNRRLCGLKFRRQHPIGSYIVDFYCAQHKLVVELDGGIHQQQADYDAEGTAYVAARDCQVIRFQNEAVLTDGSSVLTQIAAACGCESPSPNLGEGLG